MKFRTTPSSKDTIEALWRLEKIILDSLNFNEVVQEICDSVLLELGYLKLGYEIVVLCLIDGRQKSLKRISISQTEKATQALERSSKPFHDITIPLSDKKNLLIKAIKQKKSQKTNSWVDILRPALKDEEITKIQQAVGIKGSLVYPVISKNQAIGALIFSMSKPFSKISSVEEDLIRSFSDIVGLAVQNASLYSQLEDNSKKLAKANRDLRHLDKLKDEFVFIATHELKTPVTVMKGYLSMIDSGDYGQIPGKLKEPLDEITSANQQLVQLVNDLLEIARAEAKTISINTQPVDIATIVDQTLKSLKTLADQKQLKLDYHHPRTQLTVKSDPDRLQEILNNLVSNAIKYSESGTITVSHIIEDKQYLITHVTDQGIGISPENQAKIFTRFFRAEEVAGKAPGTGLGLFIVKQLVEKMGGKIWFQSKPGQGTTFSFSLPKAA